MTQEQPPGEPADRARESAADRSREQDRPKLPGWDCAPELPGLLAESFGLLDRLTGARRTELLDALVSRAARLPHAHPADRARLAPLYAVQWERAVGLLGDERAETRRLAARLLEVLRPGRPEATAALKARAEAEPSPQTLAQLLTAVGAQGPGARAAAWLRRWLDHPAPGVRLAAALALLALPDEGDEGYGGERLGELAARLVGVPGAWHASPHPPAGPFGSALRDRPRAADRFVAVLAGRSGPVERRVAVAVAAEQVRRWRRPAEVHWRTVLDAGEGRGLVVREVLTGAGRAAAPYTEELVRLVETGEAASWTREGALVALVRLGDRRALPRYRDGFGAYWARGIDVPPPDWAPDLLPVVRGVLAAAVADPRPTEALALDAALRAARSWGAAAAPAVPELAALLGAPARTARAAAEALGEIGPQAACAAAELARLATDRPWQGTQTAARAHWRVTGDPALALQAVGAAARAGLGRPVHRYLAELGPLAAEFAEPVRELLDAPGEFSRVGAAEAWWRITGDPTPAVPALLRALAPPTPSEAGPPTIEAVRVLGEIGTPAAAGAAPLLRAVLASERRYGTTVAADEELCAAVRTALQRLG
ncbi:hypothetical protein [Kitasatospora cineracea]|uniref:hypothetical protein n=1 Tax=Kitasatospora cineracea TaxID=88074 RepID=UPI0037F70B15